jgi:hypothetical protein
MHEAQIAMAEFCLLDVALRAGSAALKHEPK